MWLILDLARNKCPDPENQDTIDKNLWWRYLYFEWQQLSGSLNSLFPTLYNDFLSQLHIHHTSLSKKHQGHINLIFLTYVFSPHCSASWLDSISVILATFYTIFNLSLHPFPIRFCFVFFSIWLLSSRSNFILSQVGSNILFIYSLASIHFQFCYKYLNPCFTTLYSQMLSLAIGSNFHTFHPRQP